MVHTPHSRVSRVTVVVAPQAVISLANLSLLSPARITMRLITFTLLLTITFLTAEAQFFNAIRNLFQPVTNVVSGFGGLFNGGGRFTDDGTQQPKADGKEELLPSDCGRNTDTGTGKLCFPDGLLCQDRK